MLWKRCICQTIRGSVPRRPLFSEIPCCFDASIDLQPIRHQERWRDYWCNISEFIAEWGTWGHRRKVRLSIWEELFRCCHELVAASYNHLSHLWWWWWWWDFICLVMTSQCHSRFHSFPLELINGSLEKLSTKNLSSPKGPKLGYCGWNIWSTEMC